MIVLRAVRIGRFGAARLGPIGSDGVSQAPYSRPTGGSLRPTPLRRLACRKSHAEKTVVSL
jgi:hypothetical protein